MENLDIKFQLPSGEYKSLPLSGQEIIEALVEKGAEGVLPMLVTNIEITSTSRCGKKVTTTILNQNEIGALTEIEQT